MPQPHSLSTPDNRIQSSKERLTTVFTSLQDSSCFRLKSWPRNNQSKNTKATLGTYRKDLPIKTLVSSSINGDSLTYFVIKESGTECMFREEKRQRGRKKLKQHRTALPRTQSPRGQAGMSWAPQGAGKRARPSGVDRSHPGSIAVCLCEQGDVSISPTLNKTKQVITILKKY